MILSTPSTASMIGSAIYYEVFFFPIVFMTFLNEPFGEMTKMFNNDLLVILVQPSHMMV
jgi:hypothetical protein